MARFSVVKLVLTSTASSFYDTGVATCRSVLPVGGIACSS